MDLKENINQILLIFIFLIVAVSYNLIYLFQYMSYGGYLLPYDFNTYLYLILAVLMVAGSFIPLVIYLFYGREPEIDYNAMYEYDLPTDDPPAIVNAICGNSGYKKIGIPDIDGFNATIMDLIDRNYLILKDVQFDGDDLSSHGSVFLEINTDKDVSSLWEFERVILDFLIEYEQDGIISMDLISESMSYIESAEFFRETYEKWAYEVKQTLINDGNLKKAFLRKGDKYIKIFGILGLAVALIAQVFIRVNPLAAVYYMGVSSIILGASSAISIVMPEKIAGRWTEYGREYYAHWDSFKTYVEDFSLIKEYPPNSVNLWNRYLVYATALGVAHGVKKAMEFSLPKDILRENDIYMFQYDNTPTSVLTNAINSALEPD